MYNPNIGPPQVPPSLLTHRQVYRRPTKSMRRLPIQKLKWYSSNPTTELMICSFPDYD